MKKISMDDIVKQAMAKWPNVPHCYGWLRLDARGAWRIRDERSQTAGLFGDKIAHIALLGFINRNYNHDDRGCWYFQNGPQRVYVDLESTPYIAHTDPAHGFILHIGETVNDIDAVWMTGSGRVLLQCAGKLAQVDDRDIARCLDALRMNDEPVSDDRLLAWLDNAADTGRLTWEQEKKHLPVGRIADQSVAAYFGFVLRPQPDPM